MPPTAPQFWDQHPILLKTYLAAQLSDQYGLDVAGDLFQWSPKSFWPNDHQQMADYIPPEKKCFLTKIIVKNTNRNTNFKNQFIRNKQGVGVPEKYLKMGGHNKMTLRECGTIP